MVVCFLFSLFRITTAVGAALSQTAMVAILCALFPSIWNVGICSRHWEHDKSMPFRINV